MSALSTDSVKALISDYFDGYNEAGKLTDPAAMGKKVAEVCGKYHVSDVVQIRPSGNPMTDEGLIGMFGSGDIANSSIKSVETDMVKLIAGGKVAIATCWVEQVFDYKGTHNEDRAKYTLILEDVDGTVKIVHTQRSSGQPIPK